jgi:acetyl-CoA carboxylase carboxyl transferase subunit beta
MNWISEVVRPRIKTLFKRESPENLWIKCPDSGQMVFHKDVEANGFVIPAPTIICASPRPTGCA